MLIHIPAGLPGRAIKNPFVAKYLEGSVESKPCFGNWETGLFFCGSNVVKAHKIEHVKDIIAELFE